MIDKRKILSGYAVLGTLLVIVDFWSKDVMQQVLIERSEISVLPFLQFVLVHNRGAAFGFLGEASGWQLLFFVVIGVVVSIVIVVRLVRAAGTQKWFEIALLLILSGALGNLIDRIRVGYVIDFIELYYNSWKFPAFNVADIAIFLGAVMLIFELIGILPRRKVRE